MSEEPQLRKAAGQTVALACQAMGTRFELVLTGDDARSLRAAGEAALEEVTRWHNLLSAFDPASVVSRLNREAAERPVSVPTEVAELLRWCADMSQATAGAFNPAVGHLMRQAGFRDGPRASCPAASSFAESVHVDANRVRFTVPVALDFGAIGKGWALDRAAETLREAGVTDALLHGGTSSVITIGGPWRIALGAGDAVTLTDDALGVSAPSGRTVTDAQGVRHGHILDPRTGCSALTAGAAVTGPSAATCDAWSTALVVDPTLADALAWPTGYIAYLGISSTPSTCSPPSTPSSLLQGTSP